MVHLQSAQLAGLCFNEPRRLVVSAFGGWTGHGWDKLPPTTHQAARIDNGSRSASASASASARVSCRK